MEHCFTNFVIMKRTSVYVILILAGILWVPEYNYAQEIKATWEFPTDDLGNVSDEFQENFFEALKQRAIENYELAIAALNKAEEAAKNDQRNIAVVRFEIGKNLVHLKKYEEAEVYFKMVMEAGENKQEVMQTLFDLYMLRKEFALAIPIVKKLIEFDEDFKEDLANLYTLDEQFDKALDLLDELDKKRGESELRDTLRSRIYHQTGQQSEQIKRLSAKIEKGKSQEKDYLHLIFLYSESGDTKKAFDTAIELQIQYPNSHLAHLALYKFYLDDNNIEKAMESMTLVFGSSEIEMESKYRVLSDFVSFVNKNPSYEKDLENVVTVFSTESKGKLYEQLGDYFLAKDKKKEALAFFENGVKHEPDNYKLVKNTLLLQIDHKKFINAEQLSADSIEIFPSQPLLYLLNGVANIGINRMDVAIENLKLGLDYLFDDLGMEKDFYLQLAKAYSEKGDESAAKEFRKKADKINISN